MINTRILMKINCILLFISITFAHLQFIEKHSGALILIDIDATGTETIDEFYHKVKTALVTQQQDERKFRLLYAGEYIDQGVDKTISLADQSISILQECRIEIEFKRIMRSVNANDSDVQFWFDEETDAFSVAFNFDTIVNISDNVELDFFFLLEQRLYGITTRSSYAEIMDNSAFTIRLGRRSDDDPTLELKVDGKQYEHFESISTSVILPQHIRQTLILETRPDGNYGDSPVSPWYHVYFRLTNTEKELIVMDESGEVVAESNVIVGNWTRPNIQCDIFKCDEILLAINDIIPPTFKEFRFKSFANPPVMISPQQQLQQTSLFVLVPDMRIIAMASCILGIGLLIICVCMKENKPTKINNDEKV